MLRLETRTTTDVVILEATGDLRLGECTHLRSRADELLEQGVRVLALDLSWVDTLDAAGVGALLDARRQFEGSGGRFILLRPTDRVRRLMDVCALTDVFDVQAKADVLGGFSR